jgi:hypothetical protein
LRSEAYLQYVATTKDKAERRRWTFYEAVMVSKKWGEGVYTPSPLYLGFVIPKAAYPPVGAGSMWMVFSTVFPRPFFCTRWTAQAVQKSQE